jgi:hypothetical protein
MTGLTWSFLGKTVALSMNPNWVHFFNYTLFYIILGDTELNDYMDSLARDPDKFITPHNADTGETILHLVSILQPTFALVKNRFWQSGIFIYYFCISEIEN